MYYTPLLEMNCWPSDLGTDRTTLSSFVIDHFVQKCPVWVCVCIFSVLFSALQ